MVDSASLHSDISVVIPAYSSERWELTSAAITSVLDQSLRPTEIIVCVDHNVELRERFRREWQRIEASTSILVIDSKYVGHQGASRNSAVEEASGAIIVFLDDDATASDGWLESMVQRLEEPGTIAVGGAPIPVYSRPRPRWFPVEFDWVFGCRYVGLPLEAGPVRHLIGTTMAARRSDILAVGGFHSDDFDDLDICHRLSHANPSGRIIYDPEITVSHYVHENRLTWHYFWWRCFSVNRLKVEALKQMGEAGNLRAERSFARNILTSGLQREAGASIHGDVGGLLRAGSLVIGFAAASSGYLVGTIEWFLKGISGRRPLPR